MSKLSDSISEITLVLEEKERKQSVVLESTRAIVRECAKAIKLLHQNDLPSAKKSLSSVEGQVNALSKIDSEFRNTCAIAYQEFVELSCLMCAVEKKDFPSRQELGVDNVAYLNGLADCVGELRRAIQIALKNGDKAQADYYFGKLNEVYEELMAIKFSSSLVGPLKHKQDVARNQLEQARSELLRA
ncbi:hypothetical protein HY993_04650 [Candidatus Micrarchaeota archaeon]|nr:hypothetical protein [Candidatus Micrarchaeota archaeon]